MRNDNGGVVVVVSQQHKDGTQQTSGSYVTVPTHTFLHGTQTGHNNFNSSSSIQCTYVVQFIRATGGQTCTGRALPARRICRLDDISTRGKKCMTATTQRTTTVEYQPWWSVVGVHACCSRKHIDLRRSLHYCIYTSPTH
eukprot:scaffold1727_cov133-Cylindrotheca_fusiformis.AAC.25